MILILRKNISTDQQQVIFRALKDLEIPFESGNIDGSELLSIKDDYISKIHFDFQNFEGVSKVISTQVEYQKASRKTKNETTRVPVGEHSFSDQNFLVIAGPCSVENEDQAYQIALDVKKSGAHILRGGAYKPRTSPYSFQGLGRDGIHILERIKKDLKMPVITELMDIRHLEDIVDVADVIQVGTRNMQNFSLLKELGRINKPVLLKRGISATVKEWLLSAEYILDKGNEDVILCERGIRSFDSETRNLLDLAAVSLVRQLSHLPVIVDPSHALGRRDLIEPMSKAAVACGAHGVMIEVHDQPQKALSDGAQAMSFYQFKNLMQNLRKLTNALDVQMP